MQKFWLPLISGLLIFSQSSATADVKKVGRTTPNTTVNTILSGKGVPSTSLGSNGDFYIDKVNMNFYGPKTNGLWPMPVSMRGPAGPAGTDGKNGTDGKAGATTVAAVGGGASTPGPQGIKGDTGDQGPAGSAGVPGATGPAGPQGPQGVQGPQGNVGPQGPKGDTGDVGPQGPIGLTGAPGATGTPGTTGASGATGPAGPAGPQGATGSQGPQGDVGPQGIQGIPGVANNPLKIVDLKSGASTSWPITLTAGVATPTDTFGALTSGNSYKFTIVFQLRSSISMLNSTNAFGAYLISDPAGVNLNYVTTIGYGRYFDNATSDNKYEISFIFHGGITVPSGGPYGIVAWFKDVNGFTSGAGTYNLSGKALFEQVSSLT